MTLTDDELRELISTRFGGASLGADLAQVQRRGRQRRRRARIAAAAVAVIALSGAATYATTYAVHRQDEANRVAAFDRGCEESYTAEAAKTLRADQLPQSPGSPLIELRRADARFRLYTSPPVPLRAMTFDCAWMADGSVSGRLSFGPATFTAMGQPMVAYRDYLPDGTVAIVAQLRNPSDVVSVLPASLDVQVAQRDGFAVVWGSRDALADATLNVRDGSLSLARDQLALTATFQEEEFEQYCQRTMAPRPELASATLRLAKSRSDTLVLKVYRAEQNLAICTWQLRPDDPAHGISWTGPATSVVWSANVALGTTFYIVDADLRYAWAVGITPAQTEMVEVVTSDGRTDRAELGDGVYLALVPATTERPQKVTMTTATTIYAIINDRMTERPR